MTPTATIEAPTPPRGTPSVALGRVVLVDDHQLIRDGLRLAFDEAAGFAVVGEAGSLREAERMIHLRRPDVVVTDVRLPDGDGIGFTAALRARYPRLGIVVLTMYAGDEQLFAAHDAGASAFVGKDARSDEVVTAARHAVRHPTSFTATDLAAAVQRRARGPVGPQLSAREQQVLDLLVTGLKVESMARRLHVEPTTVKTHIQNIYAKLGAGNRVEAVMSAIRLGLIDARASGPEV
jgi:DNA-binding NarL/FixJ family response regulator